MKANPIVTNAVTNESGYMLVAVTILAGLAVIVTVLLLQIAQSDTRSSYATKVRTEQFYQSEESINRAVAWLRDNSQNLVAPFRRENFYSNFNKGEPRAGSNDATTHNVLTSVKLAGKLDQSAILTANDPKQTIATPLFPEIGNFDAVNNFAKSDLGEAKVRITLVNAVPADKTKDFGPPPNAQPKTDFYPVYRIDAMTDIDNGSHVYGIVAAKVNHLFGYAIYGQDSLELRQPCDSYNSALGAYHLTKNRNANCTAASNATVAIHKSEAIYGTVHTNGAVNNSSPFGGQVCADFTKGCANKGEVCTGADCGVALLGKYDDFNTTCPKDQGDITTKGDLTLIATGNAPSQKCWNKITVSNGDILTLETTTFPYYIRTLEFKGGKSSLNIVPDVAQGSIDLYVQTFSGDKLNGNQLLNTTTRPTQLQVFYLGTNELVLNGNASLSMALVAPNAAVTVSGSVVYYGALLAKQLTLTGNGSIHYDESLKGTGPIVDTQYRLRNLVQYYR